MYPDGLCRSEKKRHRHPKTPCQRLPAGVWKAFFGPFHSPENQRRKLLPQFETGGPDDKEDLKEDDKEDLKEDDKEDLKEDDKEDLKEDDKEDLKEDDKEDLEEDGAPDRAPVAVGV